MFCVKVTIGAVAWLVGLWRAARVRPSTLTEKRLHLVDGLFEELVIPVAAIADYSVEPKQTAEGSHGPVTVISLEFDRSLPLAQLAGGVKDVESYSFEVADAEAVAKVLEYLEVTGDPSA